MTRKEEIEQASTKELNESWLRHYFTLGVQWADENPGTKEINLINRVKRLTQALEVIKQMGTINTELTHVTASIARKALEDE